MKSRKITVALIGTPNCGKTTVFNSLTGGNVKTGNWPGVTVEKREGKLKPDSKIGSEDYDLSIVDLPGTYSLSAISEDEKVARDFILSGEPSIILNILDGSNLERSLYLTVQLLEMNAPLILAVNMIDIAERSRIQLDLEELSRQLSVPVVGMSALRKNDVSNLKKILVENAGKNISPRAHFEYANEIEAEIHACQEKTSSYALASGLESRWLCIKLLEEDRWVSSKLVENGVFTESEIGSSKKKIENMLGDSIEIIFADHRYGFIHGICQRIITKQAARESYTEKIDKVVLNRYLKLPIFLIVMYAIFWATITLGGTFTDFFEMISGVIFIDGLGFLLEKLNSPTFLKIILANGVGGGIQTVITFTPILFFMYIMFAVLEDSGYMARVAFIMDKYMSKIGLPGKAFVPLLVGFGCTVPAILATRTLENRRDRLMTIFIAPLMSCGAKMPVYALFTAAFFPKNSALIVISLYSVGVFFAIITGLMMKSTLFRHHHSYFVMELPIYHAPRPKHILFHTWMRLKSFLLKAGQVIVIAVAILTVINSFGTDGSFGNENSDKSLLTFMGKTITPLFHPIGIEKENWPATVGLLMGVFAKESVIGTLNSLYAQIKAAESEGIQEEESYLEKIKGAFTSIPENLSEVLHPFLKLFGYQEATETVASENKIFGLMSSFFSKGGFQAYAYLLFILLYFPCLSSFGVMIRESGWILAVASAVYLTSIAWSTSTLFYQMTVGKNLIYIMIAVLVFGLNLGLFFFLKYSGFSKEEYDSE
ncbi:Fe(2+) transporter permease subunit FeoB [candidate division WOR-3 bacterium]|nr:Fe(2+) transporter permease subunit FeoB [candidate division WOR-3 bacterium]